MKRIISPSVLSADFGHLADDIAMLDRSEAEWVHIDVMDGVFVPNISFGFPLMPPIRKGTKKVLDTHLMIVNPEKYIERFAKAGADIVTIHLEATDDLHGAFDSNCNVLFENNGPYDPAVGTDNYGGLCKVYKADDGAPKNICMNSEDLKIFLPLTADQLAADDQQNGVTQVTKGGAK